MKVALFLAAILSVDATGRVENAQCALDGAKAASELSDVVVYLWAATSRCTKDNVVPNGDSMSPKCAVDISAVIKAVNDMVLIVVKAVNDCADIKTANYDCGMAVGKLTSASAGISKATANTLHHCNHLEVIKSIPTSDSPVPAGIDNGGYTDVGKCVVNVKDAVSGLFEATQEASKVKSTCAGDQMQCGRNSLHLIAAVGKIGAALGMGINKCEKAAGKTAGNQDSACYGSITEAVTQIVKATDAGLLISQKCTVSNARLFELEAPAQPPQSLPTNTILVAALVPIFAVLSFVAGAKFRMGHLHPSERSRAMHSLVDGESTETDI